jgi:hypothetical protein
MRKLFELIEGWLKSVLVLCLFTTAAVLGLTTSAFIILACIRVAGLFWRELFRFPWTF